MYHKDDPNVSLSLTKGLESVHYTSIFSEFSPGAHFDLKISAHQSLEQVFMKPRYGLNYESFPFCYIHSLFCQRAWQWVEYQSANCFDPNY